MALDKKQDTHTKKNQKSSETRMEGVLYVASNNVGYADIEGMDEDIQIQPQFLNTALHHDTVEVALLQKRKDDTRIQGEVTRVLERAKEEFVGTIDKKDPNKNFAFLTPDDSRVHIDIFIPDASGKEIRHNHKALVAITDWGDVRKNPSGKIIRVLGKKGENEAEMQSILFESGYRPDFSAEAMREAEHIQKTARPIPEKEIKERKDYRGITTFTIDPADAKDLDDAVSIQKLDAETFEVGVHIADVSHYVPENSALDAQARSKGVSVYLVDRTVPMFPEALSNDVCSLHSGEDKLAFSAIFTITEKGEVKSRWFGKTIIHSDERFSYEEAQKRIDTRRGTYVEELRQLNALARIFQKQRRIRGALEFEQEEIEIELDSAGRPRRIYNKEILATHKLIEEFMVLANREVAAYFSQKEKESGGLGIYRIHEKPKKKNLNQLLAFLNVLGYNLEVPEKSISSKELNKVFRAVRGRDEEYLIDIVAMQDMEKAVYCLENKGHYGMALKDYTHFTSPIRRYADLMVHRVLWGYLNQAAPGADKASAYKRILESLLRKEVDAVTAERNSIKYKQIEYMMNPARKGVIYSGVIINVFNWGMFVQEKTTKTEGLIKTRDMKDDFYILEPDAYALVGTRKKKRYAIGQTVKIKVAGGNLDQKELSYKLA
ncbi:MAG: ribonuclease R [Candidatus Spechtbacterales bacterium]